MIPNHCVFNRNILISLTLHVNNFIPLLKKYIFPTRFSKENVRRIASHFKVDLERENDRGSPLSPENQAGSSIKKNENKVIFLCFRGIRGDLYAYLPNMSDQNSTDPDPHPCNNVSLS